MTTSTEMLMFRPDFLTTDEADRLFEASQQMSWQQNQIRMFGRMLDLPRLEGMYGDRGCTYRYANVLLEPLPWNNALLQLRERVEDTTGYRYHVVIGNRYMDGSQHIGWHRDDSPEMGDRPAIASISLGATRKFDVRDRETKETRSFELQHGSLIFMPPGFQDTHVHRIAKTARPVGERINWTFRPHVKGGSQ